MIPFSLRQLETFTAVAHARSLSEAAKQLYLSKAAVSLSLNELEKQLGYNLFDRVNNRLVINSGGKKLLPLADEILNRAKAIPNLVTSEAELEGELRIGASNTIGNQLLPFIIRDFRKIHPHVHQKVILSNSSHLCHELNQFQLDIAFIESSEASLDLIHHPFGHDKMSVICCNDHPLTQKGHLSIGHLDDNQWILREEGSGSRAFFIDHLGSKLRTWSTTLELNNSEAIINSVAAGLGLACLSELSIGTAIKARRVHKLNIALPLDREFHITIHKHKYMNPLLKTFLDFCLEWHLTGHPAFIRSGLDCKH